MPSGGWGIGDSSRWSHHEGRGRARGARHNLRIGGLWRAAERPDLGAERRSHPLIFMHNRLNLHPANGRLFGQRRLLLQRPAEGG